ncbi:hypothetical protein HP266_004459 [Salmonella enterica]|nr:hypothetical protein [Salmonella enterica]
MNNLEGLFLSGKRGRGGNAYRDAGILMLQLQRFSRMLLALPAGHSSADRDTDVIRRPARCDCTGRDDYSQCRHTDK